MVIEVVSLSISRWDKNELLAKGAFRDALISEKQIDLAYCTKSVRLDIYLKGDGKIYNIEMQVGNEYNLAVRGRFYQSSIVGESLISIYQVKLNLKQFIYILNFLKYNQLQKEFR